MRSIFLVPRRRCPRGLLLRASVVRQSVHQFPQFIQSFARDRRHRRHGRVKHGFEFSQRADPLAARELVNLGRHDSGLVHRRVQPPPCRRITPQARVPAIDDQERREVQPVLPEERPRDRLKVVAPSAGESVTRQVHQIERRSGAPRDPIDIRQPRFAGRAAGACDQLADQ
jgi:hypothetical protein